MAPPRLGVIGKIKDILTGKSPELYSPPGTLRDTQGNIVISPKEALPMGGISPFVSNVKKPSGGGGNNPSQPIQSDNIKAISLILLSIIFLSIIIGGYYYKESKEIIRINNIKISLNNLESIFKPLPEGKYILCSMKKENKNNPCVLMLKGVIK